MFDIWSAFTNEISKAEELGIEPDMEEIAGGIEDHFGLDDDSLSWLLSVSPENNGMKRERMTRAGPPLLFLRFLTAQQYFIFSVSFLNNDTLQENPAMLHDIKATTWLRRRRAL